MEGYPLAHEIFEGNTFEDNVVYHYLSKQVRLKSGISPIKRNSVYVMNIRHGSLGTDQYKLIIER